MRKKGRRVSLSRRDFVRGVCGLSAFAIVPRYVLGGDANVPPSEKINLACIGVGDQGMRVMQEYLKKPEVHIVAVCDVNRSGKYPGNKIKGREPGKEEVEKFYAEQSPTGAYKGCGAFNDYREMLAKQKDFDAVLIATPDHAHAVISMAAMQAGKHVHCQKPLTHSVYEARQLAEAARKYKVATMVFTAIQASESTRQLSEWIWAGAIGPVREVINWSNRPVWPQGIDRPQDTPPVPEGFDWDLWLGPAPYRPYHPAYQPPRPAELEAGKDMGDGNGGILFVGDNGKILCDFQGSNPRIIPDSKMQAYKQPAQTLPRSIGHDKEWFRACKGGQPGGANFEIAGPITETLMLGNVALRFKETLKWDSDSLKVTNIPEANKFIRRDYRQGWVL
jgi:hypothetical protein